mgnify:FL=1
MRGRSALNTMHSVPCEQWRGMRALLLLLVLASPASAVPLPLVCDLTSEEDPAFVIRLNKRTRTALRGVLTHQRKTLGTMSSSKPNQLRQSIWSFQSGDITHTGTAVLFADDKVWNPFKPLPKPQETNRVLFVGLDNALRSWKPRPQEFSFNRELLKAAAGFWEISSSCLGGRIMRT